MQPRMATVVACALVTFWSAMTHADDDCPDYQTPTLVVPPKCDCWCDDIFSDGLEDAVRKYKEQFCACEELPAGFECRMQALIDFYHTLDDLLTAHSDCVSSAVAFDDANARVAALLDFMERFALR